jgi:hypothetical protein
MVFHTVDHRTHPMSGFRFSRKPEALATLAARQLRARQRHSWQASTPCLLPGLVVRGIATRTPRCRELSPLAAVGTPSWARANLGYGAAFHNSRPWTPSSALKKSLPETLARAFGSEPPLPGRMLRTSLVPARVPSVRQSSRPWMPSLSTKKSVQPTAVRSEGV